MVQKEKQSSCGEYYKCLWAIMRYLAVNKILVLLNKRVCLVIGLGANDYYDVKCGGYVIQIQHTSLEISDPALS